MKLFGSIFLLFFTFWGSAQQLFTGIMNDTYVSSSFASYNPSTIVDSKSKIALGSNFNYTTISNFYSRNYLPYVAYKDPDNLLVGRYMDHKQPGFRNSYTNVEIINFKYEIDHENAFAYSFKFRMYDITTGMGDIWAQNAVLDYGPGSTQNVAEDFGGFNLTKLDFTEHAFTYARVISQDRKSLLKAGATFKLLNGLRGRYFYVNSGEYTFAAPNSSATNVTDLDADFGINVTKDALFYRNRGFGFDLGVTYEIRPDSDKQYYEMDGRKKNVRYDINKYKIKLAASITDIGAIKFMKDSVSYNFTNAATFGNMAKLYRNFDLFTDHYSYIQTLQGANAGGVKGTKQQAEYKINLPTALHLHADYHYRKNMYVSYNVSLPLYLGKDKTEVHHSFIQTLTPRVETSKYAFMLPFSMQGNGRFYLGMAGRMIVQRVTIFGGSNNISLFYGQKASLTRNFFVGFALNILYDVPSDIDDDKVSDEKDACPDDAGLYEFEGCPDTDGDEIPDKEDFCIYHKGTRETNGCPDGDGDGIIDMNDMCPTVPGLGVHYGCPDRDYDGVIDMADQCPDVPGIELNNGCPLENPGCCMDNDGDGVTNNADKCPDHAGSVYNDGCPIDSLNINKIKLKEQKEKFDPNHTNQQIKVLQNNDTIRNFISSQEELNKLVKSKNIIRGHNVYFEHDQATLTDNELRYFDQFFREVAYNESLSLMVIGHTDKDGSLDYNLILSKKRAETVKRKLIEYGFPADKIELYYFGEAKSLHKGSYTKEQKRMDRRVEIKVVQQ
ncbi:MAG: DUF5723 family protein [Bacteroidota bacterium]